jgi:hypothetical protein
MTLKGVRRLTLGFFNLRGVEKSRTYEMGTLRGPFKTVRSPHSCDCGFDIVTVLIGISRNRNDHTFLEYAPISSVHEP